MVLGFIFSQVFNQKVDNFIFYLGTGLIFWGFLASVITDSCTAFVGSEGYIRNISIPISVHYYRMFARNIIIWLHNMLIYLILLVVFRPAVAWNMLWFIPGFLLFLANIFLMGFISSILSIRYRDIPPIITNLLQVVFLSHRFSGRLILCPSDFHW